MKSVSNEYKEQLTALGRQYKVLVNYSVNGTNYTLSNSELNIVTPHYQGDLLKSVMKQLDLDSNVDIPIGTEINCQFGLLVGNDYEYIDYGNYIVYSSEKQEDLKSYKIVCYDKMLNAMKDYESLNVTFPISVKNYLSAIATKLGLTLATQTFVNDDTLIASERYLDSDGNSMGYTYRDVLDELSQVTASTICANDDELEVRYLNDTPSDQLLNETNKGTLHWQNATGNGSSTITAQIFNDIPTFNNQNGIEWTKTTISTNWQYISFVDNNFKNILYNSPQDTYYTLSFDIRTDETSGSRLNVQFKNGNGQYSLINFGYYEDGFNANEWTHVELTAQRNNVTTLSNQVLFFDTSGLQRYVNTIDIVNVKIQKGQKATPYSDVYLIDETYLKDTNVNFKEKYGPINSVVFSRSGDSDLIYRKDDESIEENGLCELKISNNQILNSNDRGNFIDEIFNQLNGLEYYMNDYVSTGITILELCDKYNVIVDDATYPCIMLNDEVNITQGFDETIHTDKPEISESDYKHADKTDRAITQTSLIVDKQNNRIEALASKIIDITTDGVTTSNLLTISNVADSEPFNLDIIPEGEDIMYQYPFSRQYPSDNLYISPRTLRFHNTTTDENIDYELPVDILYYDTNNYDEFILDYENQICKAIKRVDFDAYGQLTPITTQELYFDYPTIHLTKGDYEIYVLNGYNIYIYGKFLLQNDYTTQMSTDVQVKSTIEETANQIMLQVEQKVSNDDIIASLNLAVENDQGIVELKGNKVIIESDNFELDENGNMTCNNATANNLNIKSGSINLANEQGIGSIRLGEVFTGMHTYLGGEAIGGYAPSMLVDDVLISPVTYNIWTEEYAGYYSGCISLYRAYGTTLDQTIELNGRTGAITCVSLTQTSKEENKKNFEKLDNALDIIKNTDIYKYNFNFEKDNEKKHIGFVIGDDFNYRKEITSSKNDGADIYSMASVLWKAVQEQQEQIEDLKNQIKEMKK